MYSDFHIWTEILSDDVRIDSSEDGDEFDHDIMPVHDGSSTEEDGRLTCNIFVECILKHSRIYVICSLYFYFVKYL